MTSPVSPVRRVEPVHDAVTKTTQGSSHSDEFSVANRQQFFTDLAKTLEKTAKDSTSDAEGFRQDLVDLGRKNLSDAEAKRRQWKKDAIKSWEQTEKNIDEKEQDFKEYLKKLKRQQETQAAQAESAEKSQQITDRGKTNTEGQSTNEPHKSDTFILNAFLSIRAAIISLLLK